MTTQTAFDKPSMHFGIDVSKAHLDIHCPELNRSWRIPNTEKALLAFIRTHKAHLAQALIVVDGAGGLEYRCCSLLAQAGIAVHRTNTYQVRNYIRSLGVQAKTDRLDARLLARFACERAGQLRLFTEESPTQRRLRALVQRRDELVRMRTAEKNRLAGPQGELLKRSIGAILRALEKEIKRIEADIRQLVRADAQMRKRRDILMKIKGVGEITAHVLLACMPELGTLDRREAAALAGLAPFARDSGTLRGYRRTGGGRMQVRSALFMAALGAVNAKDSVIKDFYLRLRARGKKPIVALTAAARKLITIINAKLRDAMHTPTKAQSRLS
jgi:transposase